MCAFKSVLTPDDYMDLLGNILGNGLPLSASRAERESDWTKVNISFDKINISQLQKEELAYCDNIFNISKQQLLRNELLGR